MVIARFFFVLAGEFDDAVLANDMINNYIVMKKIKLLFICSSAVDRSPTAVDLFTRSRKYTSVAAGTHPDATRLITQGLLDWADIVFVMSEGTNRHISYLKKNFDIRGKKIYDLHIRDIYFRNDPRLIRLLRQRISRIIPTT